MEKQKQRTEEDWRRLHDQAVCAILNGRCSSSYYSEMSMSTLVGEALSGADELVKKLKEREENKA